jgi:indole-3-glycerol phosphate synthase
VFEKNAKLHQIDSIDMDKLEEIMAWKRKEVSLRERPVRDRELERFAEMHRNGLGFIESLSRPGLRIISEIKRKSPSAGQIAELPDATEQARKYYNAKADAMSVLTDEKFFGGSIQDLWDVNELLAHRSDAVPTLRKDFFVHPIQVLEAAEAGAACILIIVRALKDDDMKRLRDAADLAGLDALYEVHTEAELERCLRFDPQMVGVNNRDLTRFVTDLEYSERIIPQIPKDILPVSESGIWEYEDALRVRQAGAEAILVGEALMRAEDTEQFIEAIHSIDA